MCPDAPSPRELPQNDLTRLLHAAAGGEPAARDRLLPLVYEELLGLARRRMSSERAGHTLQATALVHEAYLRLLGSSKPEPNWSDRGHFFRAAAEAMRCILIDYARQRQRQKRGGGRQRMPLDGLDLAADADSDEILALDAAICRMEQQDARAASIVRLRYYGGLSVEDTAAALDLSPRTVKREWAFARAWLYSQLCDGET